MCTSGRLSMSPRTSPSPTDLAPEKDSRCLIVSRTSGHRRRPRVGTTALHAALATHPQLYLSPVKEPKYYS